MFGNPLGVDERRELLDEYFSLLAVLERIDAGEDAGLDVSEVSEREFDLALDYQNGFAQKALSRCPVTGEPALFAIDDVDLDGMWWNWNSPLRGMNDLPVTEFAFTGSMAIREPIAPAPFVCRPGPEAPFVVPRLLEQDGVHAVISAVEVGPHTGLLVVYYANPIPQDVPRVNDWGASSYFARTSDGFSEFEATELPSDYDFELLPWLDAGKLLWIAPGDESLTLSRSVDDCPYLDSLGSRERAMILDGRVTRLPFTDIGGSAEPPIGDS